MTTTRQLINHRRRVSAAGRSTSPAETEAPTAAAAPIPVVEAPVGGPPGPARRAAEPSAEEARPQKSVAHVLRARARAVRGALPSLPVMVGAATVLFGVLAVWFGVESHAVSDSPALHNTALTDTARTSEVKGQVSNDINAVFSYDYTDVGRTQQAASSLLAGQAVQQYDAMFATVRQQAPKEKLVLTTTVTDSGVEMLSGDRARVLIYADQSNTSAATKQTTYGAAMLAVDAVRQGRTWKIDDIATFPSAS